ncbi:hemolysin family protein [Desulfopila sp. IMCC35008]|uniref:hemolysin family protein n=1 Tax=Desulfopila sp. IMCC35008 TaxID=2653858 RepID=UPI0013D41BAD|nr:hemolysin family protein [Desulfopila sp. IMCC35008]
MLQTLITSVSLAICVSALCSVCEAVLYSLSASQVEMLKKSGYSSASHLQDLRSDIDEPITAILTLNTIANTVGASIAGAAAAKLYGDHNIIWFSSIFTLSILIFSEILPKTIGVNFAYRLAPFIAHPLRWMVIVLKPIVWLCRSITRLLPEKTSDENISAEELQTIAALSRESGEIEEDQEKVIANILQLQHKMVRQAMTPRTVTFSLEQDLTVADAMGMINRLSSHSRIPLYEKEPNDVTGIVMRKDILQAAAEGADDAVLSNFMQPVHFVPETAPLNRILVDFFDRQQHLFVVVDEYGSMTGIISMEDVLEEIVGREIIDESDKARDMRELARSRNIADKGRQQ